MGLKEILFPQKPEKRAVSELSQQDRQDLLSYSSSPGYQVMLNIMEQLCEAQETKHLQARGADEILDSHAETRAFRVFFERFQKRVNWEIGEAVGAPDNPTSFDLDDPETVERLLNPLR